MERFFDKKSKIILLIIAVLCIIMITPGVYAAKKVAVTGVKLNKGSLTLEPGESATLKATVEPSKATNKNVTWSGGTSHIKVKNGKVSVSEKATAGEKATIKVVTEDGKKKATCTVTVKATNKEKKVTKITINGATSVEKRTSNSINSKNRAK